MQVFPISIFSSLSFSKGVTKSVCWLNAFISTATHLRRAWARENMRSNCHVICKQRGAVYLPISFDSKSCAQFCSPLKTSIIFALIPCKVIPISRYMHIFLSLFSMCANTTQNILPAPDLVWVYLLFSIFYFFLSLHLAEIIHVIHSACALRYIHIYNSVKSFGKCVSFYLCLAVVISAVAAAIFACAVNFIDDHNL